jgi:tryptophan synthase alpha chain
MGVTGARTASSDLAAPLVARTKAAVADQGGETSVAVGIGVSTRDQAAEVAAYADGVIVGSALVRCLLDHEGAQALTALASLTDELAQGVRRA